MPDLSTSQGNCSAWAESIVRRGLAPPPVITNVQDVTYVFQVDPTKEPTIAEGQWLAIRTWVPSGPIVHWGSEC